MTSTSSGNSHQQQGLTLKHTLRFQWFQLHVAASQAEEAIELTRDRVMGAVFKARAQHSVLKDMAGPASMLAFTAVRVAHSSRTLSSLLKVICPQGDVICDDCQMIAEQCRFPKCPQLPSSSADNRP